MCVYIFLLAHQQTDMDEGSIRKRKESYNGSTGRSVNGRTKDKGPEKATVLQKEVSVCS